LAATRGRGGVAVIQPVPPTTTLADVLLLHGVSGCLTPPLHTVSAPAVPVCGRAVTVTMAPGPADVGFDKLYALLSGDLAGAVLVIAGVRQVPGAVWGQILSRAAAHRGALAVVIDGAVRDVALLAGESLPVWAACEHTTGAPGQAHVVAVGESIAVGDTPVDDGDLVVADAAGAVRLPRAQADLLLDHARALAEAEERILEELAAGRRLTEAYHHKRSAQAAIRAELQSNGTRSR
jgi:4-hydroxy-4-methyl-2-oxoglutarate aldolase